MAHWTKQRVKVIRPNKPEARDEGPRLLPLDKLEQQNSKLQHYVKLAGVGKTRARKEIVHSSQ